MTKKIGTLLTVLVAFLAVFCAIPASASHLRGTSLTWSPTGNPGEVQFTLQYSQRTDYVGGCNGNPCVLGGTFSVPITFGDGGSGNVLETITSLNATEDYISATGTLNHTYAGAGPYTAYYSASARISTLVSGHDQYLRMETLVSPRANPVNYAPVASLPAIVTVPLQATTGFFVSASDLDRDTITFRLSTAAEMYQLSSFSCAAQQPPGLSISSSGQVTWDITRILTAGCGYAAPASGNLWPVQFMVEDLDASGNVKSKVPVDVILKFISSTEAPPTLSLSTAGPITVQAGTPISFTATASDTTANSRVTLNATGLPLGATATNVNQSLIPPVASTFNWTPTSAQGGSYIISYTATNDTLEQALSSITLYVQNIQPPVVSCPAPLTGQYGVPLSIPVSVSDPQADAMTAVWSVDGTPVHTDSVAASNATTNLTLSPAFASTGLHAVSITATNTNNLSSSCSTTVTVNPAPQSIFFAPPTTPIAYFAGETTPLMATASSGLAVAYTITGPATLSGSTLIYTGAGTVVVTASQPGDADYTSAAPVSQTIVISIVPTAFAAPSTQVTFTSPIQTATLYLATAGTLGSINVVTKGAPNLDFNFVSGGTCVTGTAYTAGQICTVLYSFTPLYPGAREGAVVLQTSGGSVLGASYLGGTGIAPLGLFTTTSQTLSVTGLSGARGLSTDGYGNLYVLETGNGNVDKIAAGTNTVTILTNIAGTGSGGTAVDGAGNLYVGATGAQAIYELVGGKLPAITVVTGTCGSDDNLEVDGAGNLYFSCYTSQGGAIYKVDAVSHALTQLVPGGLGHRFVALAADAAGNIYAPDFSNSILYELPFGTNSLTTLVTRGALSSPHGVAVDPAGNIYVTNFNGSNILRYAAGTYALTVLPAAGQRGIAIDGKGDLYTITNDSTLAEYARTTAPGLTFPNTKFGASSNSLQTVEFENDGNAALAITSYSATTNFNVGGSGNTCATGSLASGASCFVGAQFAPTAVGSLTGTANIVDNTLGIAGTSQVIPLSGTGTQATPAITWPTPAAIVYGTALSATQLNASSTVAGTFSYSPAGGVLTVGSHLLSVTFTPTDGTDYTSATSSVTLTVSRATPAITWPTPAAIVYGTALSGTQLNASSTVAGTFSYRPASGVLTAGSHTLSVTFTPTDTANYTSAISSVTLTVNQAPQAITFTPPPSVVLYGVAPITLNATGGASGNAVVFSVLSGSGFVSGNQLTITGTGTVVVAADQLGNANYSAAAEVTQSVLVNQAPQAITFTAPSVVLYGVAPITLSATGGASGNAVVFSVLSGPASITGNLLTITGTGTVVVAADQLGNANYTAAAEVTQSVTVLPIVYTAPTEPVGTASGTQTATLLFNSSFTLGSINVLTQGAPGLDFNAASGGTCAVGSSYSAGQTCTVNYTFTPIAPGTRFGAITIVDNSTNLQASLYLIGSGTGPLALFSNGGQSAFQNTSGALNGITTDAAGNVYYTTFNTNNNGVYKVAAGTGITTQLIGGLQLGDGVAIDGAGNVFYTDYNAGTVNELLGGTGTPILIATEPNPEGLAFDAQGNLYVVVSGNQNVVKLLAGSFTPSTTYGTGIVHPQSVAVDASGNVYITDRDGAKAVVVTPDGATQTTIANGIATPAGITLDAAGNIYIAVIGSAEVEEFAAGTYAPTTLGSFVQPAFVALDPSGNVLVADRGTNTIQELTRATPAPLSFATTSEGSTSSDSPQTVTLTNDGNASLVLSGLSTASANFSLNGSSTCSSSTTLAINGSCTIGVTFAPTVPGSPLTDALTIADNNLNVVGAVQTEPLSGTGTQQTAIVTVAPVTISYTTDPTTLSASVAYLGATAPSGAVSFTIDGGSAVPAICVGSASTLTCTANYPTGTLSATAHTITATLAADTDFTTTSGSATLTVTPIAPTISFTVANHTYGDAAFTLAATSNSGAPITYSLVSGPATVSGSTLTITGAGTVTVQAAQIAAGNYIAGSQNASFTVAQLTLSAAIVGNPTKTYDSTTGATLTSANYQLAPLVGSDAITVTQPSGVYASATAGPEGVTATLSSANFSAVSGLLSNYILPAVATGPGTITQAATSSTIIWNTPAAITYGTALSVAQLNASSTIAGSFSYSPAAGAVLGAATQTLTATFTPTDTTDYKNGSASVTLLVNQATPTISWPTPAAITYGAALSGTQLNASSTVAGTFSYSPASGVLTAGLHTLSVTFTPTDGTDYTTANSTVALTVNQATPAITWPTPAAITYGAGLNGTQLDASSTVAGTFSYSPASGVLTAGLRTLSATFTPTDTTDYTTATSTVALTVNQATPTISWANPAAISYGTHLSGTQLNATASVAGTFSYNPAAGSVLTVGPHLLSVTFTPTDGTDYTSATATVSLTVAPIALTITSGSPTTIYGSTLPTIAPSYSGFIFGDSASSLTTQPTCTTTATSASNVGSYPTSCSGAVDANYIISYKPGTLTVTPAVLTVAANKLTFAYGGGDGDNDADSAANPLTYTITGFALGQTTATDLTGTPSETSNTPEGGPVGSYTITMAAGSLKLKSAYSSNYTISYVSAPLTIVQAVLTVTAASQSDVYGAVDPDNCGHPERHLTYTVSGFAYNQKQNQVLDGLPTLTTTATAKSNVGSYPITITQGSLSFDRNYASNYTLVFVNGTLTVTPARLNVVANSYSRQINQPNPAFGYTINGFVNGDSQTSATTGAPACCSTTAINSSPVGIYAITIAPGSLAAKNGNYTLNFVNGVLVVYNPRDRNDAHCDGYGNYSPNRQYDNNNWPDSSSYNYYWGNGGGGPNITH
jgi:sugar lactone lactonase YvrE